MVVTNNSSSNLIEICEGIQEICVVLGNRPGPPDSSVLPGKITKKFRTLLCQAAVPD
jgi:hypothetical protein